MAVRILRVLALLSVSTGLSAEQKVAAPKVGDRIVITLTGDLALEYVRCVGTPLRKEASKGLQVSTTATIAEELDGRRFHIEHTSHLVRGDSEEILLTLTGTIDSSQITADFTPKGTLVAASPGAKASPTTEETKTFRLQLSELRGLKLRIWKLSEEVGK